MVRNEMDNLRASRPPLEDLLPALNRLDHLLEEAVEAASEVYGTQAGTDPFRGLHIGNDEVRRLLRRAPATPILHPASRSVERHADRSRGQPSRTSWLKRRFGLSPFDVELILVSLAPEIDLRYERLFAFLNDDVTRKRPTVDLVLNLLCSSAEEKLSRRSHFDSSAPLFNHALMQLIPDPNQVHPSMLSHYLKLDDQIVRFLLAQEGLDSRLAEFSESLQPQVSIDDLPLSAETKKTLPAVVMHAWRENLPLRFYLQGYRGTGKRRVAEGLATEIGVPLLVADLARIPERDSGFRRIVQLLIRESWFCRAILYLDNVDQLFDRQRGDRWRQMLQALSRSGGITIFAGAKPWMPPGSVAAGVVTLRLDTPDFNQRRDQWRNGFITSGVGLNGHCLDVLADRFRLAPTQISDAIMTAKNLARLRTANETPPTSRNHMRERPTFAELLAAARAQAGYDLAKLARKIEPIYTWDDVVLPAGTVRQLQEICQWVKHRRSVMDHWGFGRKLSLGKGITALFAGPSGCGKTMTAEIIANEQGGLGLDLYKVDLAGVVSKYIGETEKNLDQIFSAAENSNAILFFDEADALFGRRSEVRDAHDRYANIEVSYLLQKMEAYEGIAILATNLRQNLDEAFLRRISFTVHFPFPDKQSRFRIWKTIWPPETPIADDVDPDQLATQFKLTGGNIKNVALAAAFLAAEANDFVTMAHVLDAVQREFQKMGKVAPVLSA